jgi:peptide-methionine (S)-S-oxide reductase
MSDSFSKAMFGAGCFWGVEIAFANLEGVTSTAVGYSGGSTGQPSYKEVCSGSTGHVEVVQVEYDPARVSYNELLDLFWELHDPTQVDRQGPDIGTQYRSVVFYFDDEQRRQAEESKAALDASGSLGKPVATRIEQADTFWLAEEYHQRYLEKRGMASCRVPSAS